MTMSERPNPSFKKAKELWSKQDYLAAISTFLKALIWPLTRTPYRS